MCVCICALTKGVVCVHSNRVEFYFSSGKRENLAVNFLLQTEQKKKQAETQKEKHILCTTTIF